MMKKLLLGAACIIGLGSVSTTVMAQDSVSGMDPLAKERFQIRVRAIGILPDTDSSVRFNGVTQTGDADVGDALVPEIDFTYFVTDKVGLELIAATAEHQVNYTGNLNLGETMILPPTLTLQYHPLRGENDFSPYVGAGLNYSLFYGEEDGAGFTGLDVDGGVGYALQAGFDYWLSDNWGLNLDVKKLWLDIEAEANLGATAIDADVDLDPWIIGAGASYRF